MSKMTKKLIFYQNQKWSKLPFQRVGVNEESLDVISRVKIVKKTSRIRFFITSHIKKYYF
jgi:hypothetical protein